MPRRGQEHEGSAPVAVKILEYDHSRDWEAVKRIHHEVGWLDDENASQTLRALWPDAWTASCLSHGRRMPNARSFTVPGAMRHLETDVDMTAVVGLTTSRVARKLGAAKQADGPRSSPERPMPAARWRRSACSTRASTTVSGSAPAAIRTSVRFDPATLTVDVSIPASQARRTQAVARRPRRDAGASTGPWRLRPPPPRDRPV